MTDTVTLLQAKPGRSTAKIISPSEVLSFDAGYFFLPAEVEIADIRDLAEVLEAASDPELRLLAIRGKPVPEVLAALAEDPDTWVRKKKLAFGECARRWACMDLDDARVDGADLVRDPEAAVRGAIERYLPEYFHGASCFWQLSSRAGLDAGVVRAHLWFWLDRLVGSTELRRWCKMRAPDVDASVFRQVQAHYIARPLFVGMQDPLPRRTGLLDGDRDQVSFPTNWFEGGPSLPREPMLDEYEERMEALGDGDGLDGFNDVLLRGIWAYVADGNDDFGWLKADIRSRLLEAPVGDFRDFSDLERYGSDEYLDTSIAGARQKLEEQAVKLPPETLQKYAKSLAAKFDERAELGLMLLRVCKGEVFAEAGVLDKFMPKLVGLLARRFRDYDPNSVARLFVPSLSRMQGLTPEDLAYQIRTELDEIRKERVQQDEEREQRIREAFRSGRSYSYTLDEIEGFGPLFKKRLVVQFRRSFYLFFSGTYRGPYSSEEVLNAVVRELSPAESAGVELYRVNKQGEIVQKSINQLVQQYGTVAENVVLDLAAQTAHYDEETRFMVEAPCPVRNIRPKFHQQIDDWLKLLGGVKFRKLQEWCAAITMLKRPCVCLFITGIKGVGKGLFSLGVARCFSTNGPVSLIDVFANFNDLLATCPICFADEQLPKDHRGYSKSAELREHIQSTQRAFKRKFVPNAKLLGATRTIVAANNEDVLATEENLTMSDIDAIADRYLHIRATPEAAEFLKDVDTSKWVDGDMIAEHVLWYGDQNNFKWTPKGRFLIEDDDKGQVKRAITTKDGLKAAVCEWLIGYLREPKRFHNDPASNLFVRKKGGQLLVNVQGIAKCWQQYVSNPKFCPPTGVLSRALAGICLNEENKKDQRLRHPDATGRFVKYRIVDVDMLVRWAEDTGVWERDEIEKAIQEETDDRKQMRAN